MYFLMDACQHPTILRILYFVYLLLDIVFVAIPIGLIIMLMIDFSKSVISGDEKDQIKNNKLVIKRIMYAVIIFVIPWVVNILMIFMDTVDLDIGGDYRVCITNVNEIKKGAVSIEYYDSLLETEEKIQEEKRKNNSDEGTGGSSSNTGNGGTGGGSSSSNTASGATFEAAATAMINLAKAEMGHVGGGKYSGHEDSVPWCAYFVKYILKRTTIEGKGTLLSYITNGKSLGGCGGACAGDLTAPFDSNNQLSFEKSKYYGGNYTPKKGDIIFFWNLNTHDGRYWNKTISDASHASHIGFVDYVKDGYVYTVEGNTGNRGSANNYVGSNSFSLSSDYVMAYGVWYE